MLALLNIVMFIGTEVLFTVNIEVKFLCSNSVSFTVAVTV